MRASSSWAAVVDDRGEVVLKDGSGAERYRITAPLAWDSATDPAFTNTLAFWVSQVSPGRWTVTLRPDLQWLRDPARVWPVTIDPDFSWSNGATHFHGATDTYLASGDQANNSFSAQTYLQTGNYNRTYKSLFKFDVASAIPSYAIVSAATFRAYSPPATSKALASHSLKTIVSDWDSSATWNRRKPNTPWTTTLGGDVSSNPAYSSASTNVQASSAWYQWTAPLATVQGWVAGTLPNFGFQLTTDASAPLGNAYGWASTEASMSSAFPADSTKWPTLDVQWTEGATGARPSDTFESANIDPPPADTDLEKLDSEGALRDLNVNLVTGNLLVRQRDSPDDAPELERYFNSFANDELGLGPGWRLSRSQSVRLAPAANSSVEWTSPNGAKHQFSIDPSGNYVSPPAASGATLSVGSDGRATVYNESDGTDYEFGAVSGPLAAYTGGISSRTIVRADGTGTVDESGLSTTYTRSSSGRIQTISAGPGRTYTYAYGPAGQLSGYTDPGENQTTYSYDPLGRLTEIRRPSGWKAQLGYGTTQSRRVTSVSRISPSGQSGTTTYQYLAGSTVATGPTITTTYSHDGTAVRSIDQPGAPALTVQGTLPAADGGTLTSGATYTATISATAAPSSAVKRIALWANDEQVGFKQAPDCAASCAATLSVDADSLPHGRVRLLFVAEGTDGRRRALMRYVINPMDTAPVEEEEPDTPLSPSESLADAIEQRSNFGLDASISAAQAAASSPGAQETAAEYGLPLLPQEADKLDDFDKLEESLDPVADAALSLTAGEYAGIDIGPGNDARGIIRIGFTKDVETNLQAVRGASAYPDRIVGYQATYSAAYLTNLAATIRSDDAALRADGIKLVNAVDELGPENRVTVYVDANTPAIESELIDRYGAAIIVKQVTEADATAGPGYLPSRGYASIPKFGGQTITTISRTSGHCSLGFALLGDPSGLNKEIDGPGSSGGLVVSLANPTRYSLTAGHCFEGGSQQAWQGKKPYASLVYSNFFDGTSADAALLHPNQARFHSRRIYVAPFHTRIVNYASAAANVKPGPAKACWNTKEGKDHLVCGFVEKATQPVKVRTRTGLVATITATAMVKAKCVEGDSGGVVFAKRGRDHATAIGLVTAHSADEKHCYITKVEYALGVLGDAKKIKPLGIAGPIVGKKKPKAKGVRLTANGPELEVGARLTGCATPSGPCSVTLGDWEGDPTFTYAAAICGSPASCPTPTPVAQVHWQTRTLGNCTQRVPTITVIATNSAGSTYVPLEGEPVLDCTASSCNSSTPASPDPGNLLVFRYGHAVSGWQASLLADPQGNATSITDPALAGRSYAWAPDRKRVLWSDSGELYAKVIGSNEPVQTIAQDLYEKMFVSCSPDGRYLALRGYRTLYVRDLATGATNQVAAFLDGSEGDDFSVSWSPDGNRLAFSWAPESGNAESDLIVAQADGSGQQNLTSLLTGSYRYPQWTPDGQSLIYYYYNASNTVPDPNNGFPYPVGNFAIRSVATGQTRPLSSSAPRRLENLVLSPDGHSAAYGRRNTQQVYGPQIPETDAGNSVFRIDFDGGSETQLFAGSQASSYLLASWGESVRADPAWVPPTGPPSP